MQVVASAGGVVETGVPREMQRRFCLVPDQVRAIARLASAVEACLGKPVDVEWAYANGKLYLLGVREPGEYMRPR